jgi:type I restriction enzyme S subunit
MSGHRDWTTATLGDVARWSSGGTPKAGTPQYYGGDVPWAVIGDLTDGPVARTAATITAAGLANSSAKVVPKGTVLIAMYGSIGKLGIAHVDLATNQAIACAQPDPDLLTPEYLFWYLLSQRSALRRAGKGATQSNISQTLLRSWLIRYPPITEQGRIVGELERRLSRVDAGTALLASALQRSAIAEESILLAGMTGRLVGRIDRDVPVGDHLARLAPGSARTAPDSTGLPAIPDHWRWVRLDALATVVGGVTKDTKRQQDPELPEVPYLRVANVQRGYLDLADVARIRVSASKSAALALEPGDVLFNEGGDRDKLGRGWVWEGQLPQCIHQNHVFRARLIADSVRPRLVSWWANSAARFWFETHGRQTTNLASISLSTLKALPVPVPPPAEQRALEREIDRRLSLLSKATSEADRCQSVARSLRTSLVASVLRVVPEATDMNAESREGVR